MTRENYIFIGGFITGFSMAVLLIVLRRYWLCFKGSKVEDAPREFSPNDDYVLTLVVRTDIPIVKSRLATHCSHASVMAFDALLARDPKAARFWQSTGQIKIIMAAESVHVINVLDDLARDLDVISTFVCDVRGTVVGPSPVTVLGIGPGPRSVINEITHHLGLL